jgi:peptide/nickel transport system permease protein
MSAGFRRYLRRKALWYLLALAVALTLNFLLPRLIPGNPVDAIVARLSAGGAEGESVRRVNAAYVAQFQLDRPIWIQFGAYLNNLAHGDLGVSFSLYPARVRDLIAQSLPWTIALQLPAIVIGWVLGNVLGVLAAYRGGWLDRFGFVGSLFLSSMPYYCLAVLLLYVLAIVWPVLPAGGGYSFTRTPQVSAGFLLDVLQHYWLPFLSLVIIFIGGQAAGMRTMSTYELGGDYVSYARGMGVGDRRIVGYIFRNAMLPQVTGLALSIGALVGGALVTEVVFSYPGIGTLLFAAIRQNDYPVIQGVTLLIMLTVLLANFLVDVAYGAIDPRIRDVQTGER